ncbi:MAG TPA: T3SS effector HopA1 family protein [Thermoanaerobaculia bacterium]|nr:T3SS effector HopA1 family protein [Thermoanaerobaculia bacterium]
MSDGHSVHDDLRKLLRSVVIRSPLEYELAGRTFRVAPFGAGQSPMWSNWSAGQPPLVIDLQTHIYDEAYCRPLGTRAEPPMNPVSILDALSAANAGRDRWESGWLLEQLLPNGHAMARKGDLGNTFAPGEFASINGARPANGAPLNVFFARESRTQQPGFYIANGETAAPHGAESRMTRIYFHITEEGAAALIRAVTTALNRFEVPFRHKSLSYSGVYSRADAAVLYFATRYFQIVSRLLPSIRAEVRNHLRVSTPLLSLRLYDGVGLAEDPANGESFGMNRSRLIAQAIWDAYARGMHSEESRMQELTIQFERLGLSLDRPHLRAASAGNYEAAA